MAHSDYLVSVQVLLFPLFESLQTDFLFFLNYNIILNLWHLYKGIKLLFIFLLKNSFYLLPPFQFLQLVQIHKLLVPNWIAALWKNHVLVIGMHMVNDVSCCSGVYDQQVQLRIVILQHLQYLQRLFSVCLLPLISIIQWQRHCSAESIGEKVPLQISESVEFSNDINSRPNKHHQQRLVVIVIFFFLGPLAHQTDFLTQNITTKYIGLFFPVFEVTIGNLAGIRLEVFDVFAGFAQQTRGLVDH